LSKFALGRGELKKNVPAIRRIAAIYWVTVRRAAGLLVLGISLFIQIPIISAQETFPQETDSEVSVQPLSVIPAEQAPIDDPLRAAERNLTFEEGAAAGAVSGPSVWSVIRMILVLALVAAAIYGIIFLFKKAGKQSETNDPFLKLLANTHLGANRYAQIISVGSKAWLIGSSEGGVNLISEIEDKEILDAMLLEDSRKSGITPGRFTDFFSMLRRLGVRAQTQTPSADDIRKRRERLKGL